MVGPKREVAFASDAIDEIIKVAGDDVLIGGQALAFWVRHFRVAVPPDVGAITNDIDFLTDSASNRGRVGAFAAALQGDTHFPSEHALTPLVGQAYRETADGEILNVDVLFTVYGLPAEAVRDRALRVADAEPGSSAQPFLVMHPLHVLRSRLINLYKLPEKQNDKGAMQLRMAIDVARAHLRETAQSLQPTDVATGRSPIQGLVTEIERMAVEDAGRKVATRYGLNVADAIDPALIPAGPFWTKRWPALRNLMSAGYAARFGQPSGGAKRTSRRRP